MIKFLKSWLPVFLWAGLIFFLSSWPDLKTDLPTIWDLILRKFIHIFEYAVLCLLFFRALYNHNLSFRRALLLAAFLSLLYAASDEYHQSFIFGRSGSVKDVIVDSVGIVVAVWLSKTRQNQKIRL